MPLLGLESHARTVRDECFRLGVSEPVRRPQSMWASSCSLLAIVRENDSACDIFNTHAHYDHAAAMHAGRSDRRRLRLHPRPIPPRRAARAARCSAPPATPPGPVHSLVDGQSIEIGDERAVLHTPGHAPPAGNVSPPGRSRRGRCSLADWANRHAGGEFEVLVRTIRTILFPLGDGSASIPVMDPTRRWERSASSIHSG
jgi:hypothetical protein